VYSTGDVFADMNLKGEVAPLMIRSVKLVGVSNVILYLIGVKH